MAITFALCPWICTIFQLRVAEFSTSPNYRFLILVFVSRHLRNHQISETNFNNKQAGFFVSFRGKHDFCLPRLSQLLHPNFYCYYRVNKREINFSPEFVGKNWGPELLTEDKDRQISVITIVVLLGVRTWNRSKNFLFRTVVKLN